MGSEDAGVVSRSEEPDAESRRKWERGLEELAGACRASVRDLRSMLQYASGALAMDPRRAVGAVRTALEAIDDLEVSVELVVGGARSAAECIPTAVVGVGGQVSVAAIPEANEPLAEVSVGKMLAYSSEQQQAINCDESCVIDALAGTGKSTVLDGYARRRPQERMLYMVFNKENALAAKARFPAKVECSTTHALAYAAVGYRYDPKMRKPRARELVTYLESRNRLAGLGNEHDKDALAQLALGALEGYFASAELNDQVSMGDAEDGYLLPSGTFLEGRYVARAAQALWDGMRDVNDRRVPMAHDGYLKLWQLSEPNLEKYGTILVDEGQDSNGALLQVLQAQQGKLVLVGDEHQRINEFRRAVNAMALVRCTRRFALTRSFRFGPSIASIANDLLHIFKPGSLKVVGVGRSRDGGDRSQAALFRTNAALFAAAAEWLERAGRCPKQSRSGSAIMDGVATGRGLHFVGGLKRYQFESIVDTYLLKSGRTQEVKDAFVRRFKSYDSLIAYASAVEDKEVLARVSIVDRFGDDIPAIAAAMRTSHVGANEADISLCSLHRSKGLEWDIVRLGDDFSGLMTSAGLPRAEGFMEPAEGRSAPLATSEVNLWYVAATRAREELIANAALNAYLEWMRGREGGVNGSRVVDNGRTVGAAAPQFAV